MATLEVYTIEIRPAGFECSMDGWVGFIESYVSAILFPVTMALQLLLTIIPENIAAAVCYAYMFFIYSPSFVGYLLSAIYYILMEFGFGDIYCMIFGYIYQYSDYVFMGIDWLMSKIPG